MSFSERQRKIKNRQDLAWNLKIMIKIEFKINEYLSLKLEEHGTIIYVNGEKFNHCVSLVFNVPIHDVESFDGISGCKSTKSYLLVC